MGQLFIHLDQMFTIRGKPAHPARQGLGIYCLTEWLTVLFGLPCKPALVAIEHGVWRALQTDGIG